MEEMRIQAKSFENSKKALKKFSEETTTELVLEKVDSDKGVGEFIGDLFLGRGLGLDHKVTGEELNELTNQIQGHLIDINSMQQKLIGEFGQVYRVFEDLDKEYIQGILSAIMAAQKANEKAMNAQIDIKHTIEEQEKIIIVLQKFKSRLEEFDHLSDIDSIWEELQQFQYELNAYSKQLEDISNKSDSDTINQIESIKNDFSKKLMFAYILAGSSFGLAIIEMILIVLGIL